MKKVIALITSFMFAVLSVTCFAHSGRTDANGGHWDNSAGEYHYHHGHPAHDHPGGVCPYSADYGKSQNGNGGNSYSGNSYVGNSGKKTSSTTEEKKSSPAGGIIGIATATTAGAGAYLFAKKRGW